MAIIKPFRIKYFKKLNSAIKFESVSLAFEIDCLKDINFKINENTIHGLLGPNGVEKSTIYHLMTGLLVPKNGNIKISKKDVTKYPVYLRTKKFNIGYVINMVGIYGSNP